MIEEISLGGNACSLAEVEVESWARVRLRGSSGHPSFDSRVLATLVLRDVPMIVTFAT